MFTPAIRTNDPRAQAVGARERGLELEAVAERDLLALREVQADGQEDQADDARDERARAALADAPHGILAPVSGSSVNVSPGGTRDGPRPTPWPFSIFA